MRGYQIFDLIVVLLVVSLLALAVFHRWHPKLREVWRRYRSCLGFLIPSMAIIVLAIGFLDVEKERKGEASLQTVDQQKIVERQSDDFSGVMNAVRLLKLDPAESTPGFWGHLGRGAAVMLWVMLGLELNRALLYTAIQAGQLRQEKKHSIVCGLGSIGMQIVKDLHRLGKRTVVIESNASNPHIDDAREMGALVLIRDATDDDTIQMVRPERARELFALTGNDTSNSAVIELAAKSVVAAGRSKSLGPLRCFSAVDSSELADAANQLDYTQGLQNFEVEFVLPAELSASQLLCDAVLKRLPPPPLQRSLHFVLFGFGTGGQALAKQIAEIVHLENQKRTRVTVIFEDQESVARFRSEYPAFGPDLAKYRAANPDKWDLPAEADDWAGPYHAPPHHRSPVTDAGISFVCNADFIPMPADPVSDEILGGIHYLIGRDDCLPILVVCTDDENRNARIAQRLRDRLATMEPLAADHPWYQRGMPVFVALPQHVVLHDAMKASNQPSSVSKSCELVPYSRTNHILNYDAIARSGQRTVAKAINRGFYTDTPNTADELWSAMPPWERHSNLAAAGHAPFKGRMMGTSLDFSQVKDVGESGDKKEIEDLKAAPDVKENVGEVEHNRWNAERLMAGWRYAPIPNFEDTGDVEARKQARKREKKGMTQRCERDQIVPNCRLPEEEFDKDMTQQTAMLKAFGYRLVDGGPSEPS